MLMLYGLDDSPDAATTAISLAAHWASQRRQVLLIEADPAGGTLSNNLGMPFTPGSASFVASGLPPLSNHLIDHAQDVLYENLHIMPAPASPSGASSVAEVISEHGEALRGIAEHEMAVIVEGGRITASTVNAKLALSCAALVAVARRDSQMSNVEHFKRLIGGQGRPLGCAVSIGPSPWSEEEWQEAGLTYVGAIEHAPHIAGDLSPFLSKGKGKRKARSWRSSLDTVGIELYGFAQPPPASRPAEEEAVEQAEEEAEQAEEAPEPDSPAAEAADGAQPTPEAPDDPQQADYGQQQQPQQPQQPPPADYQPPAYQPPADYGQPQQPPPADYQPQQPPADYGQQPPAYQPPPADYPPPPADYGQPQQPGYPPPPAYQQPPADYPPQHPGYPPPPVAYQPPPAHPETEEPPREPPPPTGSFRDWAAKLKGVDEHGNRSTGSGTA